MLYNLPDRFCFVVDSIEACVFFSKDRTYRYIFKVPLQLVPLNVARSLYPDLMSLIYFYEM